MIAECLRLGIFPEADPALLAASIAMFVSEQDAEDRISKRFSPKELTKTFKALKKGLLPFSKRLSYRNFDVKSLSIRPAAAVYAWSIGLSWESVREIAEMEDGNLVMLIFRTADCLRHVASLVGVFPAAAETSVTAIEIIMRDPVKVEYIGSPDSSPAMESPPDGGRSPGR